MVVVSLNPATNLGQIERAFVQGLGFFMLEEYLNNSDGLMVSDNTWTYKIPSLDNILKQFNIEVLNSGHHKNKSLSSDCLCFNLLPKYYYYMETTSHGMGLRM